MNSKDISVNGKILRQKGNHHPRGDGLVLDKAEPAKGG